MKNHFKDYFKELHGVETFEVEHGFITYTMHDQGECFITGIYIDPAVRRSRFATEMMDGFVESVADRCKYIATGIVPSMPQATDLMQTLFYYGFKVVNFNPAMGMVIFKLEHFECHSLSPSSQESALQ